MLNTSKYNTFCRKTLEYNTFCCETLKYNTFCRNLYSALWSNRNGKFAVRTDFIFYATLVTTLSRCLKQPRCLGMTSTFTLTTKTIKMLKVNEIWAKWASCQKRGGKCWGFSKKRCWSFVPSLLSRWIWRRRWRWRRTKRLSVKLVLTRPQENVT